MAKIIELKLPVKYFKKDRNNNLEARLANFPLAKGDVIRFKEWDEEKQKYTGNFFDRKVKEFHKIGKAVKYWSLEELQKHGIYILQFEDE